MLLNNNFARTKDLFKGAYSTFDKKDSYGVMPKDFSQWSEQIKKEFTNYMVKIYEMPQDDETGNMSRVDTNASGEDLEMNPKAKSQAAKSPSVKPISAKSTDALAIK
jgi:hypothetical protein